MARKLFSLLSIAGSDPCGGAGIQADIRTGSSLGLHVLTALTSVTAQNSKGIKELGPVSPILLKAQLQSIKKECEINAIKIGILGSKDNLLVVEEFLKELSYKIPVVIDPVIKTSADNGSLLEGCSSVEADKLYNVHLFPLATVITPNFSEMTNILQDNAIKSNSIAIIREKINCRNIIITDGDNKEGKIRDILITPESLYEYEHSKVETVNLHGTGCVYSTLLASFLALDNSVEDSFYLANKEMEIIVKRSVDYQLSESDYGPLNINNYKL